MNQSHQEKSNESIQNQVKNFSKKLNKRLVYNIYQNIKQKNNQNISIPVVVVQEDFRTRIERRFKKSFTNQYYTFLKKSESYSDDDSYNDQSFASIKDVYQYNLYSQNKQKIEYRQRLYKILSGNQNQKYMDKRPSNSKSRKPNCFDDIKILSPKKKARISQIRLKQQLSNRKCYQKEVCESLNQIEKSTDQMTQNNHNSCIQTYGESIRQVPQAKQLNNVPIVNRTEKSREFEKFRNFQSNQDILRKLIIKKFFNNKNKYENQKDDFLQTQNYGLKCQKYTLNDSNIEKARVGEFFKNNKDLRNRKRGNLSREKDNSKFFFLQKKENSLRNPRKIHVNDQNQKLNKTIQNQHLNKDQQLINYYNMNFDQSTQEKQQIWMEKYQKVNQMKNSKLFKLQLHQIQQKHVLCQMNRPNKKFNLNSQNVTNSEQHLRDKQ